MNKAQVVREKVKFLVPLLAGRGIKVTQRGMSAYVEYQRNIPIRVNVPFIPENATDQFLSAIEGFLDHEVSHVLHSDPKVLEEADKSGLKKIHNLIEDVYIEKKMADLFKGTKANLANMHEFFVREYTDKKLKEEPDRAMGYLMVTAVRAFAGQTVFQDYMRDKWALMGAIPTIIGPYCEKVLGEIRDSRHALEIAAEINRLLEQPPEPEEDQPDDKTGGSGDTPEEEGEEGESTKPTDQQDEEGSGESDERKETTDKDSFGDSDPDFKPDEDDDTPASEEKADQDDNESESEQSGEPDDEGEGGEDSNEEQQDSGDTEKGDSEESSGDADSNDDEGDSNEGQEDTPESNEGQEDSSDTGEEPEKDDSTGEDQAGEGEDKTSESTEGEGGGEEGDESTEDKSEEADAEPEEKDPEYTEKDKVAEPAPAGAPEYDLSDLMEGVPDFDDAIAEILTDEAIETITEADYAIYTTDFDRIETYDHATASDAAVTNMVDTVDHMIGLIQKDLERAIAAQSKAVWSTGHRSGRLNPGALARLTTFHDDRAFRRRHIHTTKDTAVELVLDCSGSMHGSKLKNASFAAYALASVLERINVPCEVLGFTTLGPISVPPEEVRKARMSGIQYAREESLYIPIFKGFNEKLDGKVKGRIAALQQARWLRENVDGESIAIAAARLAQRREERKIMIVLSDGQPACSGDFGALYADLKRTVQKIERSGITVLGIGIQSDAPKHFYSKHVILNNVSELATTVVSQIRDLLLK